MRKINKQSEKYKTKAQLKKERKKRIKKKITNGKKVFSRYI